MNHPGSELHGRQSAVRFWQTGLATLAGLLLSLCSNQTGSIDSEGPTDFLKYTEQFRQSQAFQEERRQLIESNLREYNTGYSALSSEEQAALVQALTTLFTTGTHETISGFDQAYNESLAEEPELRPFLLRFRILFGSDHPREAIFVRIYRDLLSRLTNISVEEQLARAILLKERDEYQKIYFEQRFETITNDLRWAFKNLELELMDSFSTEELARGWGRWYDNRKQTSLYELTGWRGDSVLFCYDERKNPVSEPHLDLVPIHIFYRNYLPEETWNALGGQEEEFFEQACAKPVTP